MKRMVKSKIFVLTLIVTLLALATVCVSVQAQSQATVIIADSVGGTTDPAAGTATYPDATQLTFTATPDDSFEFQYWVISTSDGSSSSPENPVTIPVSGGVTYNVQAVFQEIQAVPGQTFPSNLATAAIVVILPGNGGTTSPAPGTYALGDASQLMLVAAPASGWQFSYWVISGTPMNHGAYSFTATPTDNPYTVDHGYGNTYSYQPVFTPIGYTMPTPTPTPTGGSTGGISMETAIIIGLVVVIVIILIAFGIFAMRKK